MGLRAIIEIMGEAMALRTPILFIAFNRPEPTRRVFEEIRKAKPDRLFVAADGPRADGPGESELCRQVREIVSDIDWPCEKHFLFRDENLGCKAAMSSAIGWFFENVEEGIILEDDCLPDQSFFHFCEEMLARFRSDERVMMVSGYNIAGSWNTPFSYLFSRYGSIWGWATWRRAWKTYDANVLSWKDPANQEKVRRIIGDSFFWKIKKKKIDQVHAGIVDTWDHQWDYARFMHDGIVVVPNQNLIENIGFGPEATHTKQASGLERRKDSLPFPLKHPGSIELDRAYDKMLIREHYGKKTIIGRVIRKIKTWLRT